MATDEEPPFPTPILPYHRAEYPAINPTRPELSSKGKNVLVTGGGIGVGADIATAFARSGAAHIGLVGRRANHLEANKAAIEAAYPGVKVTALTADLADGDSTTAAVQKFAAATPSGKIDVLVANAGHQSALAPFDSVARDDFWTSFEVNNRGTFDLLRAFGPLAAPGAVVLNVSTGMVQRQYMPGSPSYHASKAAAVVLFNYWAFEHPEVRVVHFHPGIFPTEMGNKTTVALGFEMPQDNRECFFFFLSLSNKSGRKRNKERERNVNHHRVHSQPARRLRRVGGQPRGGVPGRAPAALRLGALGCRRPQIQGGRDQGRPQPVHLQPDRRRVAEWLDGGAVVAAAGRGCGARKRGWMDCLG